MRVIDEEELAILLYETEHQILTEEDRKQAELDTPPAWHLAAEFNRDDYRAQARLILKRARVAVYPGPKEVQDSP